MFDTPHNQGIVQQLIHEVQGVNHSFEACHIRCEYTHVFVYG